MRKKFWPAMENRGKRNRILISFLFTFLIASTTCFAGDVPVDRDFLRLPNQRWIWLEKAGWHSTRITLGKGKKSFKNKIWSKIYETDGERHTWAYAFFVRIKPEQFTIFDKDKNPQVAVSTYDMGNDCFIFTALAENWGIKNVKPVFRLTSAES